MRKRCLPRRVGKARGTIERHFVLDGIGLRGRPPPDNAVGILRGILRRGAKTRKKIFQQSFWSEVEVDAPPLRHEGDDNIRIVHPIAKRSLQGTRVILRQRQLIGRKLDTG